MQLTNKTRGIFCILGAALGFAMMGFFVRLAGNLPTFEKAFFRNAVAAVVAAITLKRRGISTFVPRELRGSLLARCICGTVGIIGNFYALSIINLADASMLNKLSPFWAIICSYFVLGEKCRPAQFAMVFGAFCGAMLIIKPGGTSIPIDAGLAGLIGGIGAGVAYTFVRRMSKSGLSGSVIVFYFSLFFNYCHGSVMYR